jgi:hypothetical protein
MTKLKELRALMAGFFPSPELGTFPALVNEALDDVVGERDRLRDLLDCECGKRAPEGWAWVPGYHDSEWQRGNAHVGPSTDHTHWYWRIGAWAVDGRRGRADYALEAIEAAMKEGR